MKINDSLCDEDGSAIIEFIAIAIPIFISLAIFMSNLQLDASIHYQARSLVRQLARIYVTSDSDIDGIKRMSILKETFTREVFSNTSGIASPEISLRCSSTPCLTPGSRVEVILNITRVDGGLISRVSAEEIVDIWKSS